MVTTHTARTVTVADGGWLIIPHQAAGTIVTTHTARAVTVADWGRIISPHQAADFISTGNTASTVTVADWGWINPPHQAADTVATFNIHVGDAEVGNRGANCIAEQADIICRGSVDVEIINGMSAAIIFAGEFCRAVTNGWKAFLVFCIPVCCSITIPVHQGWIGIKSDVGGLDEIRSPITGTVW